MRLKAPGYPRGEGKDDKEEVDDEEEDNRSMRVGGRLVEDDWWVDWPCFSR